MMTNVQISPLRSRNHRSATPSLPVAKYKHLSGFVIDKMGFPSWNHSFQAMLALLVIVLFSCPTYAIDNTVLDSFDAELEEGPPEVDVGTIVEGNVLGFIRGMFFTGNEFVTLDSIELDDFYLVFDGSGDVAGGQATLFWDGAGLPDESEYGLGANLTVDDLDNSLGALLLRLNSISSSGFVAITVYDFEDGGSSAQYTINPAVSASPVDFVIPFGAFTGEVDFSNIGAIMIELSGGLHAELDHFEVISILGAITKTDGLQVDVNSNEMTDPGDMIRYTIIIPSAAAVPVTFSDTLDANTSLVVGSVTTSQGAVTNGNTPGDTDVIVSTTLIAGDQVTITFDVVVNEPLPGGVTSVCNQGTISGTGLSSVQTDDPAINVESSDITCTDIFLDTVAPVITVPADTSVNVGGSTDPGNTGGSATATDNVTNSPDITYQDNTSYGPLPFETKIQRTWTATDDAGNSSSKIQTITINDLLSHALSVEEDVFGLFEPITPSGHRQLGRITLNGTITMLGSPDSIDDEPIATAAGGITAYNRSAKIVYSIGKPTTDAAKIFTIDVTTGIGTAHPLSSGTESTAVGIWYDDTAEILYGLFQSGTGNTDRQLTTINPADGTVTFLTGGSILAPIYTVGGLVAGNSSQSEFYFLGSTGGIPGRIYTVDISTSPVSVTSVGLSGANYNAIASLEFDQIGKQFYALLFVGSERQLASIDPTTGVVTTIGSTTIGGGGVSIGTYQGVSTLDPLGDQFLFVGRYNSGSGDVWALFAVDTNSGVSTYNEINVTPIKSGGYHGLEYSISHTLKDVIIVLQVLAGIDPSTPDLAPLYDVTIGGKTTMGSVITVLKELSTP